MFSYVKQILKYNCLEILTLTNVTIIRLNIITLIHFQMHHLQIQKKLTLRITLSKNLIR